MTKMKYSIPASFTSKTHEETQLNYTKLRGALLRGEKKKKKNTCEEIPFLLQVSNHEDFFAKVLHSL